MLGLCLVAVFAMSATTFVVASPALASCNQECKEQKEKEKQEAKEQKEKEKQEAAEQKQKEREEAKRAREAEIAQKKREAEEKRHPEGGEFEKFNECPFHAPPAGPEFDETQGCIFGEAGAESFFQAGKVTVHFVKPVLLSIGFEEDEETGALAVIGARNGQSISKEAEPGPDLTEIDTEALPESEKVRYEEYIANGGSTKTTETIELAVPASKIFLNEGNLLSESGEGFGFAVMIHIQNKFLGKHCYDGSTVEPIQVPFTTGETNPEPPNTPIHGFLGHISVIGEGYILKIGGQHLVNNEYAVPGVQSCGINGGADAAVDGGLGLPSPAGSNTTELVGNLYQAGAPPVEERIHH